MARPPSRSSHDRSAATRARIAKTAPPVAAGRARVASRSRRAIQRSVADAVTSHAPTRSAVRGVSGHGHAERSAPPLGEEQEPDRPDHGARDHERDGRRGTEPSRPRDRRRPAILEHEDEGGDRWERDVHHEPCPGGRPGQGRGVGAPFERPGVARGRRERHGREHERADHRCAGAAPASLCQREDEADGGADVPRAEERRRGRRAESSTPSSPRCPPAGARAPHRSRPSTRSPSRAGRA